MASGSQGTYNAFCRETENGYQLVLLVNGFATRREADAWLVDFMSPYHDDIDILVSKSDYIH